MRMIHTVRQKSCSPRSAVFIVSLVVLTLLAVLVHRSEHELIYELLMMIGLLVFSWIAACRINTSERRQLELQFEHSRAEEKQSHELSIARNIQQDLIPHDFRPFPERGEIDLFARLDGSNAVGGDFYDFFKLDNSHIFLAVGDVSGTGIPAALTMIIAKTLLRNAMVKHRHCGYALTVTSQEMARQRSPIPLSLFCATVNIYTGKVKFAAAGNALGGILRKDGFEKFPCNPEPVGSREETVYSESRVQLLADERLFFATDGLYNSRNAEDIPFGEERMIELTRSLGNDVSAEELINRLYAELQRYTALSVPLDDLCTLAFRSRYINAGNPGLVPPGALTLDLFNRLRDLEKLNSWLESSAAMLEVPPAMMMILNLVQEEWFVNIVSYAYTDKDEHVIHARLWRKEAALYLQFEDDGIPYDPTARMEVDTDLPLEQRRIGGLGIHFIRQSMDIFHYQRINNANVVTFMKRLDSPTAF